MMWVLNAESIGIGSEESAHPQSLARHLTAYTFTP